MYKILFLSRFLLLTRNLRRAVDPHSFFANPDPAVFLNADPDPGGKINANPA